jgi:hypothetical protein
MIGFRYLVVAEYKSYEAYGTPQIHLHLTSGVVVSTLPHRLLLPEVEVSIASSARCKFMSWPYCMVQNPQERACYWDVIYGER